MTPRLDLEILLAKTKTTSEYAIVKLYSWELAELLRLIPKSVAIEGDEEESCNEVSLRERQ